MRPYVALGGALVLVAVLFAVPASRAWLESDVVAPLAAQVDHSGGGYSYSGLAFWAVLGVVFAWAAYDLVFVRLRQEPDKGFFLALAPFLLAGPLGHALMLAGALPRAVAFLATEPPIYLTMAVLAVGALALGRKVALWGGWALALALVALAFPLVRASSLGHVGFILLLALVPAALLAFAYFRWRQADPVGAVFAVILAHALDGATTWMAIRDPFGLGFDAFGEKNPVSKLLVDLSNGWPFFAVKLALPLVLLTVLKPEETSSRSRAFVLFAVFVLGYGPGMANLMQVLLG